MKNIILIGLPGAGKSTTGVILAKTLGMGFIDTDILVQDRAGRILQEILDYEGPVAFLTTEEKAIISLNCTGTVIATGGSVVMSPKAIAHLKKTGVIVYLELSFAAMKRRLANITNRGIVLLPGQTLRHMFDQRVPLYENYADLTVRCSKKDAESVVQEIVTGFQTG
ncbi:Shikimate kinase [Methanoregula boonei 6A8]|jgi:shikimate kinase|uniref:Shikimate kinase n=1 Tax=Methanoregula boonei (strain DSM 21154 / JCM 14090 / 6A8) TaxID=456442 RepID=A7I7R3_METB6|nr:shikimate kinase [Methanoregula boonei]ABS55774.1 Shikimate kinase [Methanoregula boonei 6A8]